MTDELLALAVVSMTSLGMSTGVPVLYRLLVAGVESAWRFRRRDIGDR